MKKFIFLVCLLSFCKITASQLHEAIKSNNLNQVLKLLENKENSNKREGFLGFYGDTPLHIAAQIGNLEIVQELLNNKADINAKDDLGRTPLFLAIEFKHTDIATFLINSNANLNISDNDNWTPLHVAVFFKNIEIIKFLLEKKVNTQAVAKVNVKFLMNTLKNDTGEIHNYKAIDLHEDKPYLIDRYKTKSGLFIEKEYSQSDKIITNLLTN